MMITVVMIISNKSRNRFHCHKVKQKLFSHDSPRHLLTVLSLSEHYNTFFKDIIIKFVKIQVNAWSDCTISDIPWGYITFKANLLFCIRIEVMTSSCI